MALSCKQGSFAKSTGANGTTQEITIGFQAKAIIFWCERTFTGSHEGYSGALRGSIGFCDASAVASGSKAIGNCSDDGGAASDTRRIGRDANCIVAGGAGTGFNQYSYVSAISSTSFTLTHELNDTGTAFTIHYFAIGGDDITDTKADTFATILTTGNQSITSLSFQPDFVLMLSVQDPTATTNPTSGTANIGMATGSSNQGAISIAEEDARNPTDTWRYQRTDKCIVMLSPSAGSIQGEAEFTQFTSTGFDINWTDAMPNATIVYFLAIKGGNPIIGNFLQPTSTGIQTYNTVSGKTPKAVMIFSVNNTATTSVANNSRLSIGGTDGTDEGCIWYGDTDNVTPAIVARRVVTTKAIGLSTEADDATLSTTDAEADIDSFNSGNFKLNWTTADATQREILFFALSEGPTTYPITINESAVTINDTLSRIRKQVRSIIEDVFPI
jgi:hypothetical protein